MARIIQMRRGKEADLPALADGEIGITADTLKAFFGMGGTNTQLVKQADLTNGLSSKVSSSTFTDTGWLSLTLGNYAQGTVQARQLLLPYQTIQAVKIDIKIWHDNSSNGIYCTLPDNFTNMSFSGIILASVADESKQRTFSISAKSLMSQYVLNPTSTTGQLLAEFKHTFIEIF